MSVIFSLSNEDSSLSGYYLDPKELPKLMANVDLVYWDYFHVINIYHLFYRLI
jgi:hypothetical protein